MIRKTTIIFAVALASLLIGPLSADEGLVSPINGREVVMPEPSEAYSFWIIGHFYGECESASICPTGTLLSNLDLLNNSDALLLITAGDLVKIPDKQRVDNFNRIVKQQIRLPMFNAPDNHELLDRLDLFSREDYVRNWGPTYQAFTLGSARFILLDTSLNPGEIAGEQLQFLDRELKAAANDPVVRAVVIFSHYLIWCTDDPRLSLVWEHFVPYKLHYKHGIFSKTVEPLLIEAAASKPLYWISGDNGPSWSNSPFYWEVPDHDITYVATGLGGTPRDEILHAEMSPSGELSLTPVSLVGAEVGPITQYGLEYWSKYIAEEEVAKEAAKRPLVPRLRNLLLDKQFQYGVIACAPLGLLLGFIFGRRRRIH